MSFITSTQIQGGRITGGLGNQLFRIGAIIGTASKHGTNFVFPKWEYSKYFKNEDLFNAIDIHTKFRYHEQQFAFQYIPSYPDSVDLIGYFQSEKYFCHNQQEVRRVLIFKDDVINKVKDKLNIEENTCSVHIRHGDAFDRERGCGHIDCQDKHPIMTPSYYQQCFEIMLRNNVSKFYIFYDHEKTKEWIFKNIDLSHINHFFVDNLESDVEDFVAMSLCGNNIIANSTFSWWAAWLNKCENKIVCAPHSTQWFGPSYAHLDAGDVIPARWQMVKN